ncbi:cyclin G2 [Echinococcus multilocularis]|uniref:Cyclin G2 n=1 Tax=Echinococcus multilocularis TaxID=6211 RepID=A0A068YD52_ECHMU|nr:cyclin G2 [Echinococcus multilocularis]
MLATASRSHFPSSISMSIFSPTKIHGFQEWDLNNRDCHPYEDEPMPYGIRPLCNPNFPTLCPQTSLPAFPNYASTHLLPLEHQFYPNISPLFGVDSLSEDKVDASMRDESLTRLLSLHRAYYDLSPVIFCKAVCLVDTFITRVKVKPKYMMCVATACYYIASKFETSKQPRPTVDSLVRLTRCGGSVADLVRMVDIVLTKLGTSTVTAVGATSATTLDFLSAFMNDAGLKCVDLPTFLVRQVENALCATNSALFRPSCLALALLLSYKQNVPPVCVNDSESSAYKSLQSIDLRDLFTMANLGKVNWADVEACSRTLFENGTLKSYSPTRSPTHPSESLWVCTTITKNNLGVDRGG